MTVDATQPLRYSREQFIRYLDRLGVPGDCLRYARLYRQYAKQMAFQWDEEKHPRDAEGQFAKKEEAGKASEAASPDTHLSELKRKAAQLRHSPKIVWAAVDAIENEIRELEHPSERVIVTYKGSEGEYKLQTDDKGKESWVNVDKPFATPLSVAHVADLIKSGDAKKTATDISPPINAHTIADEARRLISGGSQRFQTLDWTVDDDSIIADHYVTGSRIGEITLDTGTVLPTKEKGRSILTALYDHLATSAATTAARRELEALRHYPFKNKERIATIEKLYPDLRDKSDEPEKYALPAQFVEAKHPRGKPENAGQFRPKGTAGGGGGQEKPRPAKPQHPARRVNFKGKPFDVRKHGADWFYRAAHDKEGTWSKANKATAAALDKVLGEKPKAAPQPQQQSPPQPPQPPRPEGVQPTSANVIVNAVALGQAKFLGNGQEGMVFAIANRAVKVSMTGSRAVANEAAVGEEMRKAKVPGILKTELVNHNGRDFAIRDQLTIPDRLTPEQLHEARQSILTMHAKGFSLNDRVQVGIDQMGKVAHYDVGKAAKLPDDPAEKQRRIDVDLSNLANLYQASGQTMPPPQQPAEKKKADEKEKPVWKIVPNVPSKSPDTGSTGPIERKPDEKRPPEPRIKRAEVLGDIAETYGVDPGHLDQVAEDVYGEMTEFAKERESAKAAARKLTGLTAKGIAHLENKGHDFTSSRAKGKTGGKLAKFDVYAQEIARQYPGIIGDADNPDAEFAAGLWDLLREGKTQLPGRDDPSVLKAAAKRLTSMGVSNFQPTPEPEGELQPFAKRGFVEKYQFWSVHKVR